jgi:RNA polymerase sigma-70 factor, ECF subfamily
MKTRDGSSCYPEVRVLQDDTLMAKVKDGDTEALAVLFNRYRRLVLSVAWHILHDWGEAEDLVQSVFLEILQSAAKFDPAKGTAKSWILQYAYHRSFNRRKYLNLRCIPNYPDSSRQVQEISPGWYDSSSELLESNCFIREALGQLNAKQRKILELAFYEGLSMREASERTGESFDAVRHHYYRAIGNLQSMIQTSSDAPLTKFSRESGPCLADASTRAARARLASVRSLRAVS